jgi:ABC-2 type transport system ATP-binding protein
MPTSDLPIRVVALKKNYRDGALAQRRVPALGGVSFEIQRGEIFGLLGPNGAGKTTLIKILLGIVKKTAGEASLFGMPAGARSARARVGYLPEHHRLPRHLTGFTTLEYYGGLSGLSPRQVRAKRDALLARVGLAKWGPTPVRKYSKGMQQRLGLAQALLHGPELLVLDEPTDGVDPVGRAEMRDLLREIKAEGRTVFLNSHLLQEIELICDRVVILDRGKVLREGTIADLTADSVDEVVIDVFGEAAACRAALPGRKLKDLQPLGDHRVRLALDEPDQAAIDACVDGLRGAGLSILGLSHKRQTLEEAFLKTIEASQPTAADRPGAK